MSYTTPKDEDVELDPKLLKFGMSPQQVKEVVQREKQRRRKIAKTWKPVGH